MAKFVYRAIGKGTLSRPYRFFSEGDIIKSEVEIDNPNLIPFDQKPPEKPTVLVPYMRIDGRQHRPDYGPITPALAQEQKSKGVPPTMVNPQYERSMASLAKVEDALFGELGSQKPVTADPDPAPKAEGNNGGEGTGNQDVI